MTGEPTADIAEMPPGARSLHLLRRWIVEGRFPGGTRLPPEQDLAQEIGVSRGTVRKVLDRLESEGLVKGRRCRGRTVVPGRATVRSLMTRTVGLLTMLPGDAERFRLSGWMEAVDAGVIEAAARAGLNALTLHPDGLDAEGVRRLIADPPLGVLVAHAVGENPWGPPILDRLHQGGVHLVVNGDAPELAAYDRVISDHESGAYELTRWLIRRGRRRILRVWTARLDDYWVRARFAGYERAARESGVAALEPVLVRQFPTGEDADGEIFEARARQLAGYLLEHLRRSEPVDAIMLASDPDVFPAAAALELLGARPDVDVDVVGYDNNWADCPGRCHYRAAPLATVDKLNHLTGERMLRLLLDDRNRMSGGAEPLRVMVAPRLVVPGESGAVGDGAEREPHADVARPAGE